MTRYDCDSESLCSSTNSHLVRKIGSQNQYFTGSHLKRSPIFVGRFSKETWFCHSSLLVYSVCRECRVISCIYTYVYVFHWEVLYVYMHIYVYMYIHIYVYIYIFKPHETPNIVLCGESSHRCESILFVGSVVWIPVYIYTYICICISPWSPINIYTYICKYIYIYIYIYTYICMYIYI